MAKISLKNQQPETPHIKIFPLFIFEILTHTIFPPYFCSIKVKDGTNYELLQ